MAVQPEVYARFVGERVAPEELAGARLEDLYAACACADGSEPAIVALEARYFGDVEVALGRMGLAGPRIDEVKQTLRRVLFVGEEGVSRRIAGYRGTGDLRAWLRVSATRVALKLIRKECREVVASDDALREARSSEDDPELAYMKTSYRPSFKAAFQEALDSLDAKERTLLKQQVVDGLSIDELGALYRVHRATAARWVQSARERLLARTRRAFMVRERISRDECESIMRLVQSQLDVSIARRLRAG